MLISLLFLTTLAWAEGTELSCQPNTTCRVVECEGKKLSAKDKTELVATYAYLPQALSYREEPQANMAYSHGQAKLRYLQFRVEADPAEKEMFYAFRGASSLKGRQLVSEESKDPNSRIETIVLDRGNLGKNQRSWKATLFLLAPTVRGERLLQPREMNCKITAGK